MITDILLLDIYNTFGLPTSTTVSIVFELLGAAVAVSTIKIMFQDNSLLISQYINTSTALMIISGILLSVVVSFLIGSIIQYISRLIFSFDYMNKLKYFGSIYGGVALTAIIYFILIKGLKGSAYADYQMSNGEPLKVWIQTYAFQTMLVFFAGITILLTIFKLLFKLNVLKLIVLVGTFALAMAFAGNDLVNFIGVPLAGYAAFNDFNSAVALNPDLQANEYLMDGLTGSVQTPYIFLVAAGLVMVVTLYLSKKARSVVKTSIDLSRQDEGEERFNASPIAQSIVRGSVNISEFMIKITPKAIVNFANKQFDNTKQIELQKKLGDDAPAFDLIRASVNLVVASILIAYATSHKLPLSTTYVTFMVAMGASLSDKAWGRESGVYRITGVLSVIGGWFFTALSAFTAAFIVAYILYFGGFIALIILVLLVIFILYRTNLTHTKRDKKSNEYKSGSQKLNELGIKKSCDDSIISTLNKANNAIENTIIGLEKEDRHLLKDTHKDIKNLNHDAKSYKANVYYTIKKLQEDKVKSGHYYVQVLDYLREIAHNLTFITKPTLDHVSNKHKPLSEDMMTSLKGLSEEVRTIINQIIYIINHDQYEDVAKIISSQNELLNEIHQLRKSQIKRIKSEKTSTKVSMLYMGLIHEYKNLLLHLINLLKSHRDFTLEDK